MEILTFTFAAAGLLILLVLFVSWEGKNAEDRRTRKRAKIDLDCYRTKDADYNASYDILPEWAASHKADGPQRGPIGPATGQGFDAISDGSADYGSCDSRDGEDCD